MAINKNHEFEELNGVKCAIVEKNASEKRVQFLKELLDINGYTVVVVPSPPPKVPVATPNEVNSTDIPADPPSFTLGVTDVSFNPVNAVFGRLLKTKDGRVVTLAYWQGKEEIPRDDVPYFAR